MLKRFCMRIVQKLYDNSYIEYSQINLYRYALLTGMEYILFLSTCFFYGILREKLFLTIIFIVIFSCLRTSIGGFHMKNYRSCYILSIMTFVSIIEISDSMIVSTDILLFMMLGSKP